MKQKLFSRFFSVVMVLTLLLMAMPLVPVSAASVAVIPNTGTVGSAITVNGTGFTATDPFTVVFGSTTVATGTVAAGGVVTSSFVVPPFARGTYTITVTDNHAISAATVFPFTITPKLTMINPTLGAVGTPVTISGNGFTASSTVTILFDGVAAGTATASSNGTITNVPLTIPEGARGTHTIKANDGSGDSTSLNFSVLSSITLTPVSGGVGDLVTVNGTGFAASDDIDFYFDGVAIVGADAVADTKGSFSAVITIPSSSRGAHTIQARDDSFNSNTATFTIGQNIIVTNSDNAVAGDVITITGNGFDASKTITITWGGAAIITNPATVTTDSKGAFTATITIPAGPANTYLIEVSDGINSDTANVTTVITDSISQEYTEVAPGHVGTELTFSGTGYKVNSAVTVILTAGAVQLATGTTDAVGSFSITITIPAIAGGAHTITVSDGTTSKLYDFFMEQQAPAAPALSLTEAASKADQPLVFDWADVTDDSGVTYVFQLSADSTFATLLMEQTGLDVSSVTLTEAQKLESVSKDAPYHWRVKAIDAAGNESEWAIATFYVGFTLELPVWAIIALSVVGAFLLFTFGFWLGRRSISY